MQSEQLIKELEKIAYGMDQHGGYSILDFLNEAKKLITNKPA